FMLKSAAPEAVPTVPTLAKKAMSGAKPRPAITCASSLDSESKQPATIARHNTASPLVRRESKRRIRLECPLVNVDKQSSEVSGLDGPLKSEKMKLSVQSRSLIWDSGDGRIRSPTCAFSAPPIELCAPQANRNFPSQMPLV